MKEWRTGLGHFTKNSLKTSKRRLINVQQAWSLKNFFLKCGWFLKKNPKTNKNRHNQFKTISGKRIQLLCIILAFVSFVRAFLLSQLISEKLFIQLLLISLIYLITHLIKRHICRELWFFIRAWISNSDVKQLFVKFSLENLVFVWCYCKKVSQTNNY